MPSRQRMVMRAFLQRNTQATADGLGHKRPKTWTALATVPCWSWVDREDTRHAAELTTAAGRFRAMVPLGTDVTTKDRIEKVEDRAAVELFGLSVIDAVIRRRDHIELRMRAHAA